VKDLKPYPKAESHANSKQMTYSLINIFLIIYSVFK